jgi:hypothetical protein
VPDARPSGDGLEAGVAHLVHVADDAVDDCPHAPQSAVRVAVDLAPVRADEIRLIEVLHDDDFWPGNAGHIATILAPYEHSHPTIA